MFRASFNHFRPTSITRSRNPGFTSFSGKGNGAKTLFCRFGILGCQCGLEGFTGRL